MKWFPSNIYGASDKCTGTFLLCQKSIGCPLHVCLLIFIDPNKKIIGCIWLYVINNFLVFQDNIDLLSHVHQEWLTVADTMWRSRYNNVPLQ